MDRSRPSASQHSATVRAAGGAALKLLLPAAAGERGELAAVARARRAVPGAAVFRQSQDGCQVRCGSPSRSPADAHFRGRGPLSQTQLEPARPGSPDLPIPAAWRGDPAAQPRLEHRYYVRSDAGRFPVSGRGDGLVQPLRPQLGTVQYHGDRLLSSRAGRRVPLWPARNLELGSGRPVHRGRLSGSTEAAWDRHQHGRSRACVGQRVYRTTVAIAQVRTDLPRRLRQRPGPVHRTGELLSLLQPSTPAPGARLLHARRPVPAPTQKEKVILLMGDSVPQTPWDLPLFSSRVAAFRFTRFGICRTIDMLDRRTGLSRDGTRAPIQARSGWRPSGRLLVSPLHHLRTSDFLSKQPGPPQNNSASPT